VVFAVADPNPAAAGGADRLRAAQVDVVGGVLQDEGRALLRVWLTAMTQGRPFVTAKLAASLDGRAAASDGSSRWITSEQARAHAHRVRAAVDAVAVGTGTVVVDDPALTARGADGTLDLHQPMRVVVGHRAVPAAARMLQAGADVLRLATHDVHEVLAHLAGLEVRHLLVEGGPTLVAAFLRAGVVDEVHAYIAPVLLGGGLPAVGDLGITTIGSALRLRTRSVERLGPDVLLIAEPAPADGPPGEEP
jgi:diaminohydroxyphosphoribosylaminopyrimidine deaminase/5-amino-6-(5-phosphoribosylamino)uracil reductase